MTQRVDAENKKLHDWFVNFITYFRTEYERLSDEERKFAGKWMDYLAPCQIEVFLLQEPQFQLIVKTKFSDRSDMEITINGSYNSHEFFDEVDIVIKQPKWQRTIERDELHKSLFGDETYAEHLARDLNRLVYRAKNHMFEANPHQGHGEANSMADYDYVQTFIGNIANRDHVEEVNSLLENVRRQATYYKEHPLPSPDVATSRRPLPQGYGTYFYPAIIVGEMPKFTASEILRGLTVPFTIFESKAFDTQFDSIPIIVNKDGFIYVANPNKDAVLKTLNTIMAVGILQDMKLLAVREHELAEAGYDKQSMRITGYTYSKDTLRLRLFEERFKERTPWEYKRMEVPEQTLKSIIRTAADIFNNGRFIEELRLLAEAFTHIHDTEYAQSFITSWIIIERHVSELWEKELDGKDLDHDRKSKLLNPGLWSIDYLLEALNMNDKITEAECEIFMEMKNKRNRFIHKGKQIFREDAQRCFDIAKNIVLKKLNL